MRNSSVQNRNVHFSILFGLRGRADDDRSGRDVPTGLTTPAKRPIVKRTHRTRRTIRPEPIARASFSGRPAVTVPMKNGDCRFNMHFNSERVARAWRPSGAVRYVFGFSSGPYAVCRGRIDIDPRPVVGSYRRGRRGSADVRPDGFDDSRRSRCNRSSIPPKNDTPLLLGV